MYKLAIKSKEWEDLSTQKWGTISKVHNKHLFLTKIEKFVRNLRSIDDLPLQVHELAYLWLSLTWKRLVMGGGYGSVNDTLRELDIEIPKYTPKKDEDRLCSSPVSRSMLINLFLDRIRVIYVSNIVKKHDTVGHIRCNPVRPALPGIDGKLNGLSVDVYMPKNRLLRLFMVVDKDTLRVYRNMIPKDVLLGDILEKYKIPNEEALSYLNVYSLRDYLVHETRQITNKIKQKRERVEYYKRADVTTILNEFHFMPDFMRIDFINLLLEFGFISHVKYLFSKMTINDTQYLDSVNLNKINEFITLRSPKASNTDKSSGDEDAPYELQISNMNTSQKN